MKLYDSSTTMSTASTQMSLLRTPKMASTTQRCRSAGMRCEREDRKEVGRRVPLPSLASALLWSPAEVMLRSL